MNVKRILKNRLSDMFFIYRKFNREDLSNRRNCRIIVYHAIENSNPTEDRMGLAVSPQTFYMHMKYLKENGFYVIDLIDLVERIKKKSLMPSKSIVITFDDGYKSILTNALPILKEFNFKATIFVNIYFVERKLPEYLYRHDWQTLNWKEVRQLYEAGFSIGSHALTHRRLTDVNNEELINEIMESRELIEKHIGDKIDLFGYPHGAYNDKVKMLLKKNNFRGSCTSINGINNIDTDIFALRRTEITAFDDSLSKFEKKLLGCYDWLGAIGK